jgi:flavin reductase (DIM6/NTAB) family NADH-FMN oxidoreductase RutF
VRDKSACAGLTAIPSQTLTAPRVAECPVQLEAVVEAWHGMAEDDPAQRGGRLAFEVRIQRVHVENNPCCRASAIISIPIDGAP